MGAVRFSDALDVEVIVEQIMKKESKHFDELTKEKEAENIQLNTFSLLRNYFTEFKTSLYGIQAAFDTVGLSATSSNTDKMKCNATTNDLTPGIHTINTTQLAQAEIKTANATSAQTSKTTALGISQTITFAQTATGKNLQLTISPTDTLQDVMLNFNDVAQAAQTAETEAEGTADLRYSARILSFNDSGTTKYLLQISSDNTGASQALTISGDSFFNFGNTMDAQDALFTFDGLAQSKSSNTVTDVIDGLSFTLLQADPGVGVDSTITIVTDRSNQKLAVQNSLTVMAEKYNQIIQLIDDGNNNKYTRDSMFSFIKDTMRDFTTKAYHITGSVNSTAGIGILFAPYETKYDAEDDHRYFVTGKIMIDDGSQPGHKSVLTRLDENFDDIERFFTHDTEGFIKQFSDAINKTITTPTEDGAIFNALTQIGKKYFKTSHDLVDEQNRLDKVKFDLIMKYSELKAQLAKFDNTSAAMSQQIASFSKLMRG